MCVDVCVDVSVCLCLRVFLCVCVCVHMRASVFGTSAQHQPKDSADDKAASAGSAALEPADLVLYHYNRAVVQYLRGDFGSCFETANALYKLCSNEGARAHVVVQLRSWWKPAALVHWPPNQSTLENTCTTCCSPPTHLTNCFG